MTEPMTGERLADLQTLAAHTNVEHTDYVCGYALNETIWEVRRLRAELAAKVAESERYKKALEEVERTPCTHSEIGATCLFLVATRALNPEGAE